MFTSRMLDEMHNVIHGFGTVGIGLEQYLLGFDGLVIHSTNQIHSNAVHELDRRLLGDVLKGDAFITVQPGVACFVRTADCVPILVADPVQKVVGAIHSGWRGTAADVAGETVRTMGSRFGCKAHNIHAAIGPAICANCYAVGAEVIETFASKGFPVNQWARFDEDTIRLDLVQANRDLLIRAGLNRNNIDQLDLCTSCEGAPLASYRRDRNDTRQVSFIMVNSER